MATHDAKLMRIFKRYLDRPGDKVAIAGSAVKVGPLMKQKVSLHAQYHDEDAESAPYRIDKAIEWAESSMCAVLDEKRRTLNDGSVDAELVVDVGAIANAARSTNSIVAKALNAVARNGRDSAGFLTTGTKVKFKDGDIGEIIKVKRIYSHGFVEPEYTILLPNGRSYIANEGQFTAMNAVARNYDVKPGWTNRWSGELKPGTKITVVDSPMRYGGMAGEVVRRDGSRYVVRLDDIAGMEVQLNPNQISVKNADTSTVSEKAVNAKFYATGYTNGGANEKQIGPFKTKEEAIRAGREEQGASGTFRFAGVVGEDGAYVYHNSRACNAEFNVGDKVRIKNPNRQIGQDGGTYEVTLIRPDGMISIKAPSEKVGFAVRPEQLIANAACSRNDVLGRYKPGARVAVELRTRPIVGKVMQYGGRPEVEYSPTTRTRFTGTLIKQNGDKWDIKSDSGEVYKSVSEADFGLSYNARSRNAVVAKALNAKALNYSPYRKGAWLHDDKGREYTIVEEEHWGESGGAERFVTIRDEQTKQTREVPVTELDNRFDFGEATNAATARNAVGRDKQDAASVELWAGMFENNFLKFVLPKSTDKAKARKSGESIIKRVEEALGSEGGREQLKRMGWTIQKMRDELEKGLNAATARNAVALNWNFKNSYQFFCVDPSLKAPCILSGWDYREDAKDDAAELKEAGIPHKIVSRRFLEQQGIDPNAESSWKKNRQ